MSDFWARKVAGTNPTPAAPAAPSPSAPAQQGPWWQSQQPQPVQTPPPPQQEEVAPEPGTYQGSEAPRQAKSLREAEECPDCGSGNYFRPQGSPNAMKQCYDCGFNARFMHSTAGVGIPTDGSAPVQAARQVASGGKGGVSNYQPGNFIARNVGAQ